MAKSKDSFVMLVCEGVPVGISLKVLVDKSDYFRARFSTHWNRSRFFECAFVGCIFCVCDRMFLSVVW